LTNPEKKVLDPEKKLKKGCLFWKNLPIYEAAFVMTTGSVDSAH